mmetsp:Transcript_23219/g.27922  ORF Transcript_23219/g.27922 Transcript_23219/m.27922 type:complete len:490 (+) Transcript_23219:68-1537(+)
MKSEWWLLVIVIYCTSEFILGKILTIGLRLFFQKNGMDFFDWNFGYVSLRLGITEVRLEIGHFEWRNPVKFAKNFTNFLELKRVEIRIDPRPLLTYIKGIMKSEKDLRIVHVIPALEVEGVTVNLVRKDGELSLWPALGLSEVQAVEKYDQVPDIEPNFDEEGDDFVDTNDTSIDLLSQNESHDSTNVKIPKHWSKFLGEFIVDRVVVRHVRARPEAFLVKSRDTKRDQTPVIKQRYIELSKRQLRPDYATKKKLKKRKGLYLDEVIWRAIKVVTKQVWADKNVRAIAGNATKDTVNSAFRSLGTSMQSKALNATHSAPKIKVGNTKDENNYYPDQFALRVQILQAKYLPKTTNSKKPSTYVKLAIGKKLVKAKSDIVANSCNPEFNFSADLAPIEIHQPLKVQLLTHGLFSKDTKLLPTLKVPIDHLFTPSAPPQEDLWLSFPSSSVDDEDDDQDDAADIPPTTLDDINNNKTPCIHLVLSVISVSKL